MGDVDGVCLCIGGDVGGGLCVCHCGEVVMVTVVVENFMVVVSQTK